MDTMSYESMVEEKIAKNKEANKLVMDALPEKYHPFVLMMKKDVKLSNTKWDLNDWYKSHGVYIYKDKTYLSQEHAYFPVAGRLAQLVDYANDNGYSYTISKPEFVEIKNTSCLLKTVTIYDKDGKVFRQASGTVSIGFNGTGVDATNPIENAETSALGRALSGVGMGTRTDIASADEIEEAKRRQKIADASNEDEPDITPNSEDNSEDKKTPENGPKDSSPVKESTNSNSKNIAKVAENEKAIYVIEGIKEVTKGTSLWKTVSISDIETGESFETWVLPQNVEKFSCNPKDRIHAKFRETTIGKEQMRLLRAFEKVA